MNEAVRRRPRRHRSPWPRRVAVVAVAALLLAIGVALAGALGDGPPAATTETYVRTIDPSAP